MPPASSSSFHAAGLAGGWNRLQLRRATKAVAAVFHEVGKPLELQEVRCWMEQRGNFSTIFYHFLPFSAIFYPGFEDRWQLSFGMGTWNWMEMDETAWNWMPCLENHQDLPGKLRLVAFECSSRLWVLQLFGRHGGSSYMWWHIVWGFEHEYWVSSGLHDAAVWWEACLKTIQNQVYLHCQPKSYLHFTWQFGLILLNGGRTIPVTEYESFGEFWLRFSILVTSCSARFLCPTSWTRVSCSFGWRQCPQCRGGTKEKHWFLYVFKNICWTAWSSFFEQHNWEPRHKICRVLRALLQKDTAHALCTAIPHRCSFVSEWQPVRTSKCLATRGGSHDLWKRLAHGGLLSCPRGTWYRFQIGDPKATRWWLIFNVNRWEKHL